MELQPKADTNVLIVLAVDLPPPLHGQALVNAAIASLLASRRGNLKVINIASAGWRRDFSYHVRRTFSIATVGWHLLRFSGARPHTFYSVVQGGHGIFYNIFMVCIAKILGYKIVLHHHSSVHTLNYSYRFDALSRIAGRDSVHVALGDAMKEDLRKYSAVRTILISHTAYHVLDPKVSNSEHSETRLGNPSIKIGLLSNLSREKGLDLAIETLQQGILSGLNLELILAGIPVSVVAEQTIQSAALKLGDKLKLLGPVSVSEKDTFFNNIDVFIFPTTYKYEAQPRVVIEAMSYGLPIIVTDRGYINELVGKDGAMLPGNEGFPPAAVQLLAKWTLEPQAAVEVGRKARVRYEALHRQSQAEMELLLSTICQEEGIA